MRCSACGTNLPNQANFCWNCGQRQRPAARPASNAQSPTPTTVGPEVIHGLDCVLRQNYGAHYYYRSIDSALDIGFVTLKENREWSTDDGDYIHGYAELTPQGWDYVRAHADEHKWRCRCKGCGEFAIECCRSCRASLIEIGYLIEGMCPEHWLGLHPSIAERRANGPSSRSKELLDLLPSGTARQLFVDERLATGMVSDVWTPRDRPGFSAEVVVKIPISALPSEIAAANLHRDKEYIAVTVYAPTEGGPAYLRLVVMPDKSYFGRGQWLSVAALRVRDCRVFIDVRPIYEEVKRVCANKPFSSLFPEVYGSLRIPSEDHIPEEVFSRRRRAVVCWPNYVPGESGVNEIEM